MLACFGPKENKTRIHTKNEGDRCAWEALKCKERMELTCKEIDLRA